MYLGVVKSSNYLILWELVFLYDQLVLHIEEMLAAADVKYSTWQGKQAVSAGRS